MKSKDITLSASGDGHTLREAVEYMIKEQSG